jgi:hypothetical protein
MDSRLVNEKGIVIKYLEYIFYYTIVWPPILQEDDGESKKI